jgi:hypothetical protein
MGGAAQKQQGQTGQGKTPRPLKTDIQISAAQSLSSLEILVEKEIQSLYVTVFLTKGPGVL